MACLQLFVGNLPKACTHVDSIYSLGPYLVPLVVGDDDPFDCGQPSRDLGQR